MPEENIIPWGADFAHEAGIVFMSYAVVYLRMQPRYTTPIRYRVRDLIMAPSPSFRSRLSHSPAKIKKSRKDNALTPLATA